VGVNHYTFITDFLYEGKDAWPLVRKVLQEHPEKKQGMPYAWELFDTFDAFPCVGDGHICEFVPGFQAKGAYYGKTFGIDGGVDFTKYAAKWDDVFADMEAQAYGVKPVEPIPTHTAETYQDEDYFIDVMSALLDGESIERTVNLPNRGQAPGLPLGAILEQTTLINAAGFHPLAYDSIDPGILAIMNRISSAQGLTVEAALKGDRKLVVQAFMADLTAIRQADAEKLADCILDTHREYLPQFFK
jgi:alpha-galactosidase